VKTVDELKKAFAVYYSEMDRCETAGAYWALLHLALVLPDICAALESDPTTKAGTRYIDWCAAHFPSSPSLTAGDRFQMRNAVLHEGTTLPTNRAADARQHTQYSSFSFVEPGAVNVEVHQNISPDGKNLTVNVKALADDTRKAMLHWFDALQKNALLNTWVEQNLPRVARLQQKQSFLPTTTPDGRVLVVTHAHIVTSST
jgi:hypothetical protein